MPGGRPTKYSKRIADMICIRLALGSSLNALCKQKIYPSKSTVFKWLLEIPEFSDNYRRARELQQESNLEEIVEIADDGTNDWMEKLNKEGEIIGWTLNGEHVQRSKLRVDTRKWIMERMAAKKYMPQSKVDLTSSDQTMSPTKSLSDDELTDQLEKLGVKLD